MNELLVTLELFETDRSLPPPPHGGVLENQKSGDCCLSPRRVRSKKRSQDHHSCSTIYRSRHHVSSVQDHLLRKLYLLLLGIPLRREGTHLVLSDRQRQGRLGHDRGRLRSYLRHGHVRARIQRVRNGIRPRAGPRTHPLQN